MRFTKDFSHKSTYSLHHIVRILLNWRRRSPSRNKTLNMKEMKFLRYTCFPFFSCPINDMPRREKYSSMNNDAYIKLFSQSIEPMSNGDGQTNERYHVSIGNIILDCIGTISVSIQDKILVNIQCLPRIERSLRQNIIKWNLIESWWWSSYLN